MTNEYLTHKLPSGTFEHQKGANDRMFLQKWQRKKKHIVFNNISICRQRKAQLAKKSLLTSLIFCSFFSCVSHPFSYVFQTFLVNLKCFSIFHVKCHRISLYLNFLLYFACKWISFMKPQAVGKKSKHS